MTVSSWVDVPPGVPVHHHCVVSVESSHDPKHWVDASTATPALVAWQYPDAVAWVREQLAEHVAGATDEHRGRVEAHLGAYVPAEVGQQARHYRQWSGEGTYLPGLWERLPEVLQTGRWTVEAWQIGPGRKLVLQLLAYADRGQSAGAVCDRHQRPEDRPYLGLTTGQAEHYARFDQLHVPA